jgi:chitodextrinase
MSLRSLVMIVLCAIACTQLSACGGASATEAPATQACGSFESWVGNGKINIVDFTAMTGGASSPFRFRLKFNSFASVPSDGFMGPITQGTMTFSYPRQNNPEVPYVKDAPYPAPYTQGPAFGEKISFQAREVACNVFEVHWKEINKGDTVTHVQDFNRQHVCTNITNINRVPIPAEVDPFDLAKQLNNTTLFPNGSPVAAPSFGWFPLCGAMSQSAESDKVWENQLHYLVYTAP